MDDFFKNHNGGIIHSKQTLLLLQIMFASNTSNIHSHHQLKEGEDVMLIGMT
jgi:hypothetical protein